MIITTGGFTKRDMDYLDLCFISVVESVSIDELCLCYECQKDNL